MKIAIYGGAFDPIGTHHLNIANKIINLNIVDEVWIMPCYVSMSNKKMADANHRLNICKLALECNDNPQIKLCDFEISNKLTLSSIEIIKLFLKEYKTDNNSDNTFYFLMGADNAINAPNWNNFNESIKLIPFIIIPRKGYNLHQDLWCFKQPHVVITDIVEDGSSTEIRNIINKKNTPNSDPNIICTKVKEYINNNNLYYY